LNRAISRGGTVTENDQRPFCTKVELLTRKVGFDATLVSIIETVTNDVCAVPVTLPTRVLQLAMNEISASA